MRASAPGALRAPASSGARAREPAARRARRRAWRPPPRSPPRSCAPARAGDSSGPSRCSPAACARPARRRADRRERGRGRPVVRGARADHRRQEGGHAGRRQARRQRAQRRGVAADLEPEPAVALQIDQPRRHDVGVDAAAPAARRRAPVRTSTMRSPSTTSAPGTRRPSRSRRPVDGVSVVAAGAILFSSAGTPPSYVATPSEVRMRLLLTPALTPVLLAGALALPLLRGARPRPRRRRRRSAAAPPPRLDLRRRPGVSLSGHRRRRCPTACASTSSASTRRAWSPTTRWCAPAAATRSRRASPASPTSSST